MKTLTAILLLFITCSVYGQRIGYIVSKTSGFAEKPTVKKTENVELVNQIVNNYFVDLNFCVENHMKGNNNLFVIETQTKSVYVERKRINKKGKYRRIKR